MFQPWSGTATSLISVAIVTSYLKTPSHRSTDFWIHPSTLHVPKPPSIRHPDTELHRSLHPIFHPHYSIEPPGQTIVHSHQPPPPVLHLVSCRPRPDTQFPVILCSPAPRSYLFRLVPCLVAPLLLTSMLLEPLSTPVGYPFPVTLLLRYLSTPPPSLP